MSGSTSLDGATALVAEAIQAGADDASIRAMLVRSLGVRNPNSCQTAELSAILGLHLLKMGELQDSRKYLEISLSSVEKNGGQMHPAVINISYSLARLCSAEKRTDEVVLHLQRAVQVLGATKAPGDTLSAAKLKLVAGLRAAGRLTEARDLLQESVDVLDQTSPESGQLTTTLSLLGSVQQALGESCDAEYSLRRALVLTQRQKGETSPATATACNNLATSLFILERSEEALACLHRCKKIWDQLGRLNSRQLRNKASAYANLAAVLDAKGQKGKELQMQAVAMRKEAEELLAQESRPVPKKQPDPEIARQLLAQANERLQVEEATIAALSSMHSRTVHPQTPTSLGWDSRGWLQPSQSTSTTRPSTSGLDLLSPASLPYEIAEGTITPLGARETIRPVFSLPTLPPNCTYPRPPADVDDVPDGEILEMDSSPGSPTPPPDEDTVSTVLAEPEDQEQAEEVPEQGKEQEQEEVPKQGKQGQQQGVPEQGKPEPGPGNHAASPDPAPTPLSTPLPGPDPKPASTIRRRTDEDLGCPIKHATAKAVEAEPKHPGAQAVAGGTAACAVCTIL